MKNLNLLAMFAAITLSAPAIAAPAQFPDQQARVSTSGLDLRTDAGAKALELRILRAATELCGQPSSFDLLGYRKAQRCRDDAQSAAAAQRNARVASARSPTNGVIASAR